MARNKKIIIIPALLLLLAGAGVVANNAMNSKVEDSFELNPTSDVSFRFTSAAGTLNWAQAVPTDLNVKIELTVEGATKKALESPVFGIASYTIVMEEADDIVIPFNSDNCTTTQTTTKCEILQNVGNIYTTKDANDTIINPTDLVDLAHNANAVNMWTGSTNNFMTGTVNYQINKIAVTDQKLNKVESTNFDASNKFGLTIAPTSVGLKVIA